MWDSKIVVNTWRLTWRRQFELCNVAAGSSNTGGEDVPAAAVSSKLGSGFGLWLESGVPRESGSAATTQDPGLRGRRPLVGPKQHRQRKKRRKCRDDEF